MQGNRRRAIGKVTADRRAQNPPLVTGSRGIDHAKVEQTLDDAAVLDLLESPVHEPAATSGGTSEDPGVQQSGDARESIGRSAPVLTTIFTVAFLILSTTIAFASVASRAPGIARILLLVYVVVSPFAVASIVREEARLKKAHLKASHGPTTG
jgi:hypothetical protein